MHIGAGLVQHCKFFACVSGLWILEMYVHPYCVKLLLVTGIFVIRFGVKCRAWD